VNRRLDHAVCKATAVLNMNMMMCGNRHLLAPRGIMLLIKAFRRRSEYHGLNRSRMKPREIRPPCVVQTSPAPLGAFWLLATVLGPPISSPCNRGVGVQRQILEAPSDLAERAGSGPDTPSR
jgi:hypothetical protein